MDCARSMAAQQMLNSPQVRSGSHTVHAQKPRDTTKKPTYVGGEKKKKKDTIAALSLNNESVITAQGTIVFGRGT